MGFGFLIAGGALLLNIAVPAYTDPLAGLILLYAAEKLAAYEKHFRKAAFFAVVFSVAGLLSFILSVVSFFLAKELPIVTGILAFLRDLALIGFLLPALAGIRSLSDEVGCDDIAGTAKRTAPLIVGVISLYAVAETPLLSLLPVKAAATVSVFLVFGYLVSVAAFLLIAFRAYRWICLPEDKDMKAKDDFLTKLMKKGGNGEP